MASRIRESLTREQHFLTKLWFILVSLLVSGVFCRSMVWCPWYYLSTISILIHLFGIIGSFHQTPTLIYVIYSI